MLITASFEISFVKIAWWVWLSFDRTKQYCSIERMNIFWMADLHLRNLCMYACMYAGDQTGDSQCLASILNDPKW